MATTRKEYRELIECRVNRLNDVLNLNNSAPYVAQYAAHYGGWNLQRYDEKCSIVGGAFSFDYRKSSGEMLAYLDGVLLGLRARLDR